MPLGSGGDAFSPCHYRVEERSRGIPLKKLSDNVLRSFPFPVGIAGVFELRFLHHGRRHYSGSVSRFNRHPFFQDSFDILNSSSLSFMDICSHKQSFPLLPLRTSMATSLIQIPNVARYRKYPLTGASPPIGDGMRLAFLTVVRSSTIQPTN